MRRKLTSLLVTAAVASAALYLSPLAYAQEILDSVYYLQSAGGIGSPPFPFNPSPCAPVAQVSPGVYLVEDGSYSRSMANGSSMTMMVRADNTGIPPLPGGSGDSTNWVPTPMGGGQPINYASGLWIEGTNQDAGNISLDLHNTVSGDNYQLLSTTNLLSGSWDVGQIIFGASDGETPFPYFVSITNSAATFFRGHHANPVMQIQSILPAIEAITNDPGQVGVFRIFDEGSATDDLTVYYTISGNATNGVDYVTISNAATVPANQNSVNIQIVPLPVGIIPDKSIVLTVVQNPAYLIDPSYCSATNVLYANPEMFPTAYGDNQKICPSPYSSGSFYVNVNNPSGLPLSYIVVTNTVHGTVSINAQGLATYRPASSFEGIDSFAYTATSGGYT